MFSHRILTDIGYKPTYRNKYVTVHDGMLWVYSIRIRIQTSISIAHIHHQTCVSKHTHPSNPIVCISKGVCPNTHPSHTIISKQIYPYYTFITKHTYPNKYIHITHSSPNIHIQANISI